MLNHSVISCLWNIDLVIFLKTFRYFTTWHLWNLYFPRITWSILLLPVCICDIVMRYPSVVRWGLYCLYPWNTVYVSQYSSFFTLSVLFKAVTIKLLLIYYIIFEYEYLRNKNIFPFPDKSSDIVTNINRQLIYINSHKHKLSLKVRQSLFR